MKKKLTITATLMVSMLFGSIILPHPASANPITETTLTFQDNCVVTGDNDTPLRVRKTPNGIAIGSLKVGSQIIAYKVVQDRDGNNWTKIKYKKGFGYVWTGFISCG